MKKIRPSTQLFALSVLNILFGVSFAFFTDNKVDAIAVFVSILTGIFLFLLGLDLRLKWENKP